MTTLISLDDAEVQRKIAQLRPVNGYLLMADLVGSTKLKQRKGFKDWAADFLFPFKTLQANISQKAMKVVGDMAMYWFPDSANPDPEEIMMGLRKVQMESSGVFKMAFVRCQNVYEVSFHERVPEDVYGSDIDLTARLLTARLGTSAKKQGEIRMNVTCREEIAKRLKGIDFLHEITGPRQKTLKGFPERIGYFLWRVPSRTVRRRGVLLRNLNQDRSVHR